MSGSKSNPLNSFDSTLQVHKGFYNAEQSVISSVVSQVNSLLKQHPGSNVIVAGHSLGAALAQLTGMDLIKNGISCRVIDFGQPRTGTKEYSTFSTKKLSTTRYTHDKDRVPHLPFEEQMSYYHVCREYFENSSGAVRACDTSCEDPSCADQYAYSVTGWDDHGVYLGLSLTCSAVS
jgi:predicted lipase